MNVYTKSHKEHWLRDKDQDGTILILEDGSQWEIVPTDRRTTSRWLRISTIVVTDPKEKGHYLLNNITEGETAQADYLGGDIKQTISKQAA
jgi:hypothetical protein